MNLICQKCGEVLVDGREHSTEADCLASMKELNRRIRKSLSHAAYDVAKCRAKKHGGRKSIAQLNVCMICMAAGFSGYLVAHEIATTGIIPEAARGQG